jgi:hypothetical protein
MQRVPVHSSSEGCVQVLYTNVDGILRGAYLTRDTVCYRCGQPPQAGETFTTVPRRNFSAATWSHDGDCPKGS